MEGSTEIVDLQHIKFLSSTLAQLIKTATNHALIYSIFHSKSKIGGSCASLAQG